jgi:hypothetical protein
MAQSDVGNDSRIMKTITKKILNAHQQEQIMTQQEISLELLQRENFEKCKARIRNSYLDFGMNKTVLAYRLNERQTHSGSSTLLRIMVDIDGTLPKEERTARPYRVVFNDTEVTLKQQDLEELYQEAVIMAEQQVAERLRIKTAADLAML